jgi:hypothetical protein
LGDGAPKAHRQRLPGVLGSFGQGERNDLKERERKKNEEGG